MTKKQKKERIPKMVHVKWWGVVNETGHMYEVCKTKPGVLKRRFIKHIGHRLARVEIREIKR